VFSFPQLENRLLSELDSSTAPFSPSSDPIRLAASAVDLPESPRDEDSFDFGSSGDEHKYPTSPQRKSGGKFIVSQLDPLADQTLLIARLQQKERQAAISAALQQSATQLSSKSVTASVSGGTQRTSQTSHRTNATNVSQLSRPARK
jgi:hypothetical protein